MFIQKKNLKVLAKISIFAFFFTGIFSFCFAHEALAHAENSQDSKIVTGEIHDDHCGSNGLLSADKVTSNQDSPRQNFQKYFPAITVFNNPSLDFSVFLSEYPLALSRGEPPSTQAPLLQVFRC